MTVTYRCDNCGTTADMPNLLIPLGWLAEQRVTDIANGKHMCPRCVERASAVMPALSVLPSGHDA